MSCVKEEENRGIVDFFSGSQLIDGGALRRGYGWNKQKLFMDMIIDTSSRMAAQKILWDAGLQDITLPGGAFFDR